MQHQPPSRSSRQAGIVALGATFALACFIALGLAGLNPPEAVPETAPLSTFSSGRAMRHLRVIARAPHPTGSAENHAVRDYIVEQLATLGLDPEVQQATAVNDEFLSPVSSGRVHNVVARLKGTVSSRSVLLAGHYDSVPTGPGASDDGAAVAALLETARALHSGAPFRNDVIFLFTDGEEPGMLGASVCGRASLGSRCEPDD